MRVLADTSIWIDHFRSGNSDLTAALNLGQIVIHPMVIGELACGNLRNRNGILALLCNLPSVVIATHDEALGFIHRRTLMGKGIGFVDVHLLASVALTHDARLWTRDARLGAAAMVLGLDFSVGML